MKLINPDDKQNELFRVMVSLHVFKKMNQVCGKPQATFRKLTKWPQISKNQQSQSQTDSNSGKVKFSTENSLEACALKKQRSALVGIVTFSMHPSMLTPQSRQTEGMARLDNHVRVC